MGFERKPDGAVILDDMLADQHGGQAVILLPRRIEGHGEQRQVLLSAHPVQARAPPTARRAGQGPSERNASASASRSIVEADTSPRSQTSRTES